MSPTLTTRIIRFAAVFGAVLVITHSFAQTNALKKTPTKPVRVATKADTPKKATATAKTLAKQPLQTMTVSNLRSYVKAMRTKLKLNPNDMLRYYEEHDGLLLAGKTEEAEELEEAMEKRRERLSPIEAMLYNLEIRAYPNDHLNPNSYVTAQDHRDKMPIAPVTANSAGLKSGAISNPMWEFVGPKNAFSRSPFGQGPVDTMYNGRINRIAYDPQTQGVVYVTAPGGGVWKSTDGGKNWNALGDGLSTLFVTAVAASGNLVLVGMGDYEYPERGIYSKGIFRSTDGGKTFSHRRSEGACHLLGQRHYD